MITIEDIIRRAKSYMPTMDEPRIRKAFHYVEDIHKSHYRFSGEPYINHLLLVVDILLPLKPDENTLIAALMHDISQGENYDFHFIQQSFGDEVVSMVEALEKLNSISFRKATTELESLRKMFLSMATDLRVVLIRMADRLQNMETLHFVDESKRKTIAKETLNIYVPIVARLGIYKIKWRLEDLAFKYLHEADYTDLNLQLQQYIQQQFTVIDYIKNELKSFLHAHGIEAQIEGRLKNLYSIYKKLKKKNHTSVYELFDIFAIRVIVPARFYPDGKEATDHLYALLGLIHNKWLPMNDRFKDYIALPKQNGYQSLHTTVLGLTPEPLHQPTEIQIRSDKMHEESNFGIASHWLYKENKNLLRDQQRPYSPAGSTEEAKVEDNIESFNRIHRDLVDEQSLSRPLKLDVFKDRIFVLTPEGDIKDLPIGATPIDFAYSIHTDIGHRCNGAKVNNEIVPLDYQLKSGEIVHVLLKSKPDPKAHWLSIVKTTHAKNKIRSYLKSLDKDRSFRDGKQILNQLLGQSGYPLLDDNLSILKKYDQKNLPFGQRESLLAEIGNGAVLPNLVLKKISQKQVKNPPLTLKKSPTVPAESYAQELAKDHELKILIGGESHVPYKLSLCCKPRVGDNILAYISRGKSVRIHLQSCKVLKNVDQRRTLEAKWTLNSVNHKHYPVEIFLAAIDRVGLIRDLADVVSSFNVNILDFSLQERKDNLIQRKMVFEVSDQEQLLKIIKRLEQVRSVVKVMKPA